MARLRRGESYSHWCQECILATDPGEKQQVTRRLYVKRADVAEANAESTKSPRPFAPVRIEAIGVGRDLSAWLRRDPALVHALSPEQFEVFICDRLYAMGFEPKRVGNTFHRDGGIDVVFWPRQAGAFPFLGAAQIKHHREAGHKEGPGPVRDFAGSICGQPFSAGLLVTNTSFTPSAEWFARQQGGLIRLRGFDDIRRWLADNFSSVEEWRELPRSIELAPGLVVNLAAESMPCSSSRL